MEISIEVCGSLEGASIVSVPVQIEAVGELSFAGKADERSFVVAVDRTNMSLNTMQLIIGFVAVVAYEGLISP